jgi:hypothetical protein
MSDATDTRADPRSVPQLLSDLVRELTTLFRKEGQLVRAELSEKVTQIELGAGSLAAGAICLLAALLVLLQALVIALANAGLGAGWSSLLVGVIMAVIGAVLINRGSAAMKLKNLTPERSAEQMKRDASLVKEQVR